MNKNYELMFQNLFLKLDLINASDYIKHLYYRKIQLLKLEFKHIINSSLDIKIIIDKVTLLDRELNNLIKASNNNNKLTITDFVNSKIRSYNMQTKQLKKDGNIIRTKIIAYFLTLSIMLSSSAYLINKEKNSTKEVLYKTDTYTYYDDSGVYPRTSSYSEKTDSQALLIKRITPWHIEGNQGKRTIYTYRINNMTLDEIFNADNFESILANFDYTSENEYKYKNELRDTDRYDESIYRVVYQTQDSNDYIVKYPNISGKVLALLFTNLMIYMLMYNINKGPLVESLITSIRELKTNDELINIDYEIINSLRKKRRIVK